MTKEQIQLEAYKQIRYAVNLDLENDELSGFIHGVIALENALSESMQDKKDTQDTQEQPNKPDKPQLDINLLEKLGKEQNHIELAKPLSPPLAPPLR